jgi:hypothetical protein
MGQDAKLEHRLAAIMATDVVGQPTVPFSSQATGRPRQAGGGAATGWPAGISGMPSAFPSDAALQGQFIGFWSRNSGRESALGRSEGGSFSTDRLRSPYHLLDPLPHPSAAR